MQNLFSLACGLLFGIGLSLSGMTDPQVVLGFLDLFGSWNPALIFVMASAVPVTFIGYRFVLKRQQPLCDREFHLPANKSIDKKLIIGAVLFGTGWGILGLCPGPAVASLSSLQPKVFGFVFFMILGMFVVERATNK